MRTMTIDFVKRKATETNSFVERTIQAYNEKYPDENKKLVRDGTRRPRKVEEQKALDIFPLK